MSSRIASRSLRESLAGVNCPIIRRDQEIADWLQDVCCDWEVRESGGSMERPIEYRDIRTGVDGQECNLVGDFTDYPEPPASGDVFEFRGLATRALLRATAYPESKHGRLCVVFEVEVGR